MQQSLPSQITRDEKTSQKEVNVKEQEHHNEVMEHLITATPIGINPIKPIHMSTDYRDSTAQGK